MQKFCLPLFAACLLLLPACSGGKDTDKAAQAAPVHVRPVARQSLPRLLHVVGNVKASASVAVTPRVTGEIREVHFTEGQDVKAGDPLITIDTRPFEAVLREKRGLLAKSQAQLNKALDDRGRYGKLVGGGYVSRESYEQTATEAAALKATVQSDKAAVESAELDLSYCRVTAPISGRVGALAVDKGNMVQSNASTPVVTIDTLSPIYVTFSVPEVHLAVILERMQREYNISPRVGAPQVILRETITKEAAAQACFDRELGKVPHYGNVELAVSPLPRGQGNIVETGDFLPKDKQAAIKVIQTQFVEAALEGARDCLQSGDLTGYPVVDTKVVITGIERRDGVTTVPGCHMAAVQALKEALSKAGPVTLEPIMRVTMSLPESELGSAISLFNSVGGRIDHMEDQAGQKIVHGTAPLRQLFGFSTRLRSATQGRAGMVITFERFDRP